LLSIQEEVRPLQHNSIIHFSPLPSFLA
jgi:hypothetical protein